MTSQPDSWHGYAPLSPEEASRLLLFHLARIWSAVDVAPGLTRDLDTWTQNIQDTDRFERPWQLVETYNEWGEGTGSKSSNGDHAERLAIILGPRTASSTNCTKS